MDRPRMKKQSGFTLVELMVVISIIGILAVTAVPLYQTWQQRAYGSEASLMMKKLMDGEIIYYLEHNDFFPAAGENILIPPDGTPTPVTAIQDIESALKIGIPQGHFLEYSINNYGDNCYVIIKANFPLFKGGYRELHGQLDKGGKTYIFPGG
ncbi:MAG: type II secretion system protein [Desulfobacteraceae bacterium]